MYAVCQNEKYQKLPTNHIFAVNKHWGLVLLIAVVKGKHLSYSVLICQKH